MTRKSRSALEQRRTGVRRTSDASGHRQDRWTQTIKTALIVGGLIFAAYYLLTGSDPLGLFGQDEATPTARPAIPGSLGGSGDWWQILFTDPQTVNDPKDLRGSIPEKLIDYINNAQRTIHVAAFEFDLTAVAEALIAARERGVEVQWVTDDESGIDEDEDEGNDLFPLLEEAGIEVRDDARTALMHNKFWIFDGQMVWTGSTNVTVNGNFRNNNNVIVIASPEVGAIYEREFAELWSGQFGPTSPSEVDSQTVTIDGTPIQILFAAEDRVADRLSTLINGAQSSIRFMAFSFLPQEQGESR